MNESRHVIFDAVAGRWLCRHCGRSEYLDGTMVFAGDVIAHGELFLSAHETCLSSREIDEQRMGEGAHT